MLTSSISLDLTQTEVSIALQHFLHSGGVERSDVAVRNAMGLLGLSLPPVRVVDALIADLLGGWGFAGSDSAAPFEGLANPTVSPVISHEEWISFLRCLKRSAMEWSGDDKQADERDAFAAISSPLQRWSSRSRASSFRRSTLGGAALGPRETRGSVVSDLAEHAHKNGMTVQDTAVDTAKLQRLCDNFGLNVDILGTLAATDADGDGAVDFEEFRALVSSEDSIEAYLPSFVVCGAFEAHVTSSGAMLPQQEWLDTDCVVLVAPLTRVLEAMPYLPRHIASSVPPPAAPDPPSSDECDSTLPYQPRGSTALQVQLFRSMVPMDHAHVASSDAAAVAGQSSHTAMRSTHTARGKAVDKPPTCDTSTPRSSIPCDCDPRMVTLERYALMMRMWGKSAKDVNRMLHSQLVEVRVRALRLLRRQSSVVRSGSLNGRGKQLLYQACTDADEENVMEGRLTSASYSAEFDDLSGSSTLVEEHNESSRRWDASSSKNHEVLSASVVLHSAVNKVVATHLQNLQSRRSDPRNEVLMRQIPHAARRSSLSTTRSPSGSSRERSSPLHAPKHAPRERAPVATRSGCPLTPAAPKSARNPSTPRGAQTSSPTTAKELRHRGRRHSPLRTALFPDAPPSHEGQSRRPESGLTIRQLLRQLSNRTATTSEQERLHQARLEQWARCCSSSANTAASTAYSSGLSASSLSQSPSNNGGTSTADLLLSATRPLTAAVGEKRVAAGGGKPPTLFHVPSRPNTAGRSRDAQPPQQPMSSSTRSNGASLAATSVGAVTAVVSEVSEDTAAPSVVEEDEADVVRRAPRSPSPPPLRKALSPPLPVLSQIETKPRHQRRPFRESPPRATVRGRRASQRTQPVASTGSLENLANKRLELRGAEPQLPANMTRSQQPSHLSAGAVPLSSTAVIAGGIPAQPSGVGDAAQRDARLMQLRRQSAARIIQHSLRSASQSRRQKAADEARVAHLRLEQAVLLLQAVGRSFQVRRQQCRAWRAAVVAAAANKSATSRSSKRSHAHRQAPAHRTKPVTGRDRPSLLEALLLLQRTGRGAADRSLLYARKQERHREEEEELLNRIFFSDDEAFGFALPEDVTTRAGIGQGPSQEPPLSEDLQPAAADPIDAIGVESPSLVSLDATQPTPHKAAVTAVALSSPPHANEKDSGGGVEAEPEKLASQSTPRQALMSITSDASIVEPTLDLPLCGSLTSAPPRRVTPDGDSMSQSHASAVHRVLGTVVLGNPFSFPAGHQGRPSGFSISVRNFSEERVSSIRKSIASLQKVGVSPFPTLSEFAGEVDVENRQRHKQDDSQDEDDSAYAAGRSFRVVEVQPTVESPALALYTVAHERVAPHAAFTRILAVLRGSYARRRLCWKRNVKRYSAPVRLLQRCGRGLAARRALGELVWAMGEASREVQRWAKRQAAATVIQCFVRKVEARSLYLRLKRRALLRTDLRVLADAVDSQVQQRLEYKHR